MKEKIKIITVTYAEKVDELSKKYSRSLAKILVRMMNGHQIDELINRLKDKD